MLNLKYNATYNQPFVACLQLCVTFILKISFYCRIICIFVSNEAISRSEKGNKSNLINVMCICCLPWKTFVNFPGHLIQIHLVPTDSRERREGQNFHNYFPSYCLLWPSARDNFSFQGKFCFIFTFSAVLLSNLLRGNLQEYRKSFQLWMLLKTRNFLQYRWNKYISEGSKNFLFVS